MEDRPNAPGLRRYTTPAGGFCLLVFFWGLFPIATKLGVQDISPILYTSLRLAIAACIVAIFTHYRHHGHIKLTYKHHWRMLFMGIFMSGLPSAAFAFALRFAAAGTISIIWSTLPLFSALFSLRDVREVKGWSLLFSMIVGSLGVFIVLTGALPFLPSSFSTSSFSLVENGPAFVGEVAVLVSAALSAFALRIANQQRLLDIPASLVTAWQLMYGSVFCILLSVLFEPNRFVHFTFGVIGTLCYAVLCACGCNILTHWLVRRIGVVRTAYSDFLVPGMTLVLAYFLLGERITWIAVGGLTLIAAGAILLMKKANIAEKQREEIVIEKQDT